MNLNQILIIGAIASFISCTKEPNGSAAIGAFENSSFIINEGPFGSGTGTISAINTDTVIKQAFLSTNGFPMGNILQDAIIDDSLLFAAINLSNQVHGMSRSTLTHKWTASISSPRALLSHEGKLYVSNWSNDYLKVLDQISGTMIDSVELFGKSGGMIAFDQELFIALDGGFGNDHRIAVVNLNTLSVDTLKVGDKPQSMVVKNGLIYVLCEGYTDWSGSASTAASIWTVSPNTHLTEEVATAPDENSHATMLNVLSTGEFVFLNGNYSASPMQWIEGTSWSNSTMINTSAYSLNVYNDTLYVMDAKDYASTGMVYIFNRTGVLLDSIEAGVIPRKFLK